MNNAAKFTKKGSITLDIDFEKVSNTTCRVTATVTDTGIGIKEKDLKQIFDSFTQVDTKRNRTEEGTGLGLAICKQLVKLMDGKLWVDSTYGVGSTFGFEILNEVESWEPIGNIEAAISNLETNVFRVTSKIVDAKILVVDDNSLNLQVAEGLLAPYGVEPILVGSGKAAIQCFEQLQPFDLIFMDHMMPGMDGVETMKIIREMEGGAEAKIIALTANALSGARKKYREVGFDDFLAKPIEPKQMDIILNEYLGHKIVEE